MEIRLSGRSNLSTIVDKSDYIALSLGSYKWRQTTGQSTVYAYTSIKHKTIYLHRLIMGVENEPRSVCVDHIDHDGLNNTRENLRITNPQGNNRNTEKRRSKKTTSIYKGVRKDKRSNRLRPWIASIRLSGKQQYLGFFRTEVEAAQAYNQAATIHFGLFALLNELPDSSLSA